MTARIRSPSSQRVGQALEDDHAGALASHVSVSGSIEHFAAAIGGHHPGFGKVDDELGRKNQIDSAGKRQVALARSAGSDTQGAPRPATRSTRYPTAMLGP